MSLQAKLHRVPKLQNDAFTLRHDILPHFGTTWHYHPEIELHYLIIGQGTRFIGNHIAHFQPNDLVLLGPNLPHTWKCSIKDSKEHVEALVLHVHPECFGSEFLKYSETQEIKKLVEIAQNGLIIKGRTRNIITRLLWKMKNQEGLPKVITLFHIFHTISTSHEFELLDAQQGQSRLNKLDEIRMDKVMTYTLQNFKKKINLQEISALVNLSPTSFCRYFKMTANKSYLDFLIEVRLNHACRLLVDTDFIIEHVAQESGFDNSSNFYRHFKKYKGSTPVDYKRAFFNKS